MMLDENLLIWMTVLLLILAIGIIMLVLVYQKKQLQLVNEREQLKVAFEKEILESRLEIQEQTMKNISQELHDNIGQVMGLVKLNINSINYNDPEKFREKINSCSQLLNQVIQDIRNLSKSLHTDIVKDIGLVKSIENEFDLIKKAAGYKTALLQEGESCSLSHQQELILFRVFQEAINNIIRHAQASAIVVKLSYANLFVLEITDDGKGFDFSLSNQKASYGCGLRNMRNRSRLIGADFDIISQPGAGTTIRLSMQC